ncbi:unnamed protein product [Clonostachys rosea]|uniref:Uncharacterized protein n=1 Tax=Bionectria ochroleuca TaxID=29856 RepID=A0ABY6UMS3_BIOOC|nr:unnamed protein product [Clonostachys rosea]
MAREGRNEDVLRKSWEEFAATHPDNAALIRRSVTEMKMFFGCEIINSNTTLRDEERINVDFLIISNPEYQGVVALLQQDDEPWDVSQKTLDGTFLTRSKMIASLRGQKAEAWSIRKSGLCAR